MVLLEKEREREDEIVLRLKTKCLNKGRERKRGDLFAILRRRKDKIIFL